MATRSSAVAGVDGQRDEEEGPVCCPAVCRQEVGERHILLGLDTFTGGFEAGPELGGGNAGLWEHPD